MPSFLENIFGAGNAQELSDQLDAKLKAENLRDLQSGRWTQARYDEAEGNIVPLNVNAELAESFRAGWKEGEDNIRGTLSTSINAGARYSIGSLTSIIPWQLWLIAGLALVYYFGGFAYLKRRINA